MLISTSTGLSQHNNDEVVRK